MTAARSHTPQLKRLYTFAGVQTVSYIGSRVTLVALPWSVLTITGSTAQTGFVLLAQSVPYATGGFFLGPLIDKFPRRTLLVAADVVRAVLVGLLAVSASLQVVNIPAYAVTVFFVGCANIVSGAAREAVVPQIAGKSRRDLVRLNSLIQLGRDGSSAVGPALGGVLVATAGAGPALGVDALSYVVSAVGTFWALRGVRRVEPKSREDEGTPRYWHDIRTGLIFLWRQPIVRLITVQSTLTNMLLTPLTALVLLQIAQASWHSSSSLGLVFSVFGIASILGGVFLSVRPHSLPSFRYYGLALILLVLPVWTFVSGDVVAVACGMAVMGIGNAAVNALGDTTLQEIIPDDMQGRSFASITSALALFEPVGLAVVGVVLTVLPATNTAAVLLVPLTALALIVGFATPRLPGLEAKSTSRGEGRAPDSPRATQSTS